MAVQATTKRNLKRLYRNSGEQDLTNDLSENVEFVVIQTIVGGHEVECDLKKLFPEGAFPPPCMGRAATAFGVNTVVGNSVAGLEKDDPAAVAAKMQERWDTIATEGVWSEGRQGPNVKDVIQAVLEEARKRGKPVTEATAQLVKQKLKSGELTVKGLLDNAKIQAEYQRILFAKQEALMQAAQARAAEAEGAESGTDDLLGI